MATGGARMVKLAYSSGHPSLGVGSGNTPAIIDATADIRMAVSSIILSKTFDNDMICASEQSVIVEDAIYNVVCQEFKNRGAYFLDEEKKEKLRQVLIVNERLNPDIVGQSVQTIAQLAGFSIAPEAKVLIAETETIGVDEPLSYEKLSPTVGYTHAKFRYTQIADRLNLGGNNEAEKVARLVQAVDNLKQQLDIPLSIREVLQGKCTDEEFYGAIDMLADRAFDDQCTGANPRYSLIQDLANLYRISYEGQPPQAAAICHIPGYGTPTAAQPQCVTA
jgi:hypothetical protein